MQIKVQAGDISSIVADAVVALAHLGRVHASASRASPSSVSRSLAEGSSITTSRRRASSAPSTGPSR